MKRDIAVATGRLLGLAVVMLAAAILSTTANAADGIAGYWLKISGDRNNAIMQIYPNGEGYDGRIAKLQFSTFIAGESSAAGPVPEELDGKPKTDLLNPDPGLRSRRVEGMKIISDFTKEGDGLWSGASIYNPEDGKTYHCKATLSDDGRTLTVRGYVGVPMFGRSQTWERLETPTAVPWGVAAPVR